MHEWLGPPFNLTMKPRAVPSYPLWLPQASSHLLCAGAIRGTHRKLAATVHQDWSSTSHVILCYHDLSCLAECSWLYGMTSIRVLWDVIWDDKWDGSFKG